MQEKRAHYLDRPAEVKEILEHGAEKAEQVSAGTMERVYQAMGLRR